MSNSTETHRLKFERALDKDDYGLILSESGRLRGIWVPDHLWAEPFPTSVVKICMENFGVNPNAPEEAPYQQQPQSLH